MAKIPRNSILFGLSGRMGDVVYRQVNGETIAAVYNPSTKPQTERQRRQADKMRVAAPQAKEALRDDNVRAYYEKKKDKVKLSSAYLTAVTDIMRHGCLDEIKTPVKRKRERKVSRRG